MYYDNCEYPYVEWTLVIYFSMKLSRETFHHRSSTVDGRPIEKLTGRSRRRIRTNSVVLRELQTLPARHVDETSKVYRFNKNEFFRLFIFIRRKLKISNSFRTETMELKKKKNPVNWVMILLENKSPINARIALYRNTLKRVKTYGKMSNTQQNK